MPPFRFRPTPNLSSGPANVYVGSGPVLPALPVKSAHDARTDVGTRPGLDVGKGRRGSPALGLGDGHRSTSRSGQTPGLGSRARSAPICFPDSGVDRRVGRGRQGRPGGSTILHVSVYQGQSLWGLRAESCNRCRGRERACHSMQVTHEKSGVTRITGLLEWARILGSDQDWTRI